MKEADKIVCELIIHGSAVAEELYGVELLTQAYRQVYPDRAKAFDAEQKKKQA